MKSNLTFISILLLVALTQFSCVKEFTPSLSKYEDLLVIDGEVTNLPGSYTIRLSKSGSLKQILEYTPYGGCKVKITDNNGNVAVLKETREGEYKTDSTSFRGETGKQYKITIQTSDNEEYESAFEELKAPVKIKNLYVELEHKDVSLEEDARKHKYGRDGYQFYVDTEPAPTADNFLYWKLWSTYKFNADYFIHYYLDWTGYHKVDHSDTLRTCYRSQFIYDYYLKTTATTNQKELTRFPLNYEDNYSKALSIRYSLEVKQYTLNENVYTYFSKVKKMRDMGGDLYTTQPYPLKGNVVNTKDPDKIALGCFIVAGVEEKRIFINNNPSISMRYTTCSLPDPEWPPKGNFTPESYPIFFFDTPLYPYLVWFDDPGCLDCRVTGYQTKPSFWVD